jgi:hypothetical protein
MHGNLRIPHFLRFVCETHGIPDMIFLACCRDTLGTSIGDDIDQDTLHK